jgi:hypothetical protein
MVNCEWWIAARKRPAAWNGKGTPWRALTTVRTFQFHTRQGSPAGSRILSPEALREGKALPYRTRYPPPARNSTNPKSRRPASVHVSFPLRALEYSASQLVIEGSPV